MKKFKFSLFGLLFLFAIAGAFATASKHDASKDPVTYHYTSTSNVLGVMQNIGNWEVAGSSCGSVGTIPCAFTYDGNFASYLQTFGTAYDLKEAADTRRTP
jgi:hypothetical protein